MDETIYDTTTVNDYGESNVDNDTPYQVQQWEERMKHNPTNFRRNQRINQSRIDKQKLAKKKKGLL